MEGHFVQSGSGFGEGEDNGFGGEVEVETGTAVHRYRMLLEGLTPAKYECDLR